MILCQANSGGGVRVHKYVMDSNERSLRAFITGVHYERSLFIRIEEEYNE